MNNGDTPPGVFGDCDDEDLEDLDHAMALVASTEEAHKSARQRAGRVMARMLGRNAQRKAIAHRADVSDQTVTNMAFGLPPKKPATKGD